MDNPVLLHALRSSVERLRNNLPAENPSAIVLAVQTAVEIGIESFRSQQFAQSTDESFRRIVVNTLRRLRFVHAKFPLNHSSDLITGTACRVKRDKPQNAF